MPQDSRRRAGINSSKLLEIKGYEVFRVHSRGCDAFYPNLSQCEYNGPENR
jgi:hypothetical protein